MTITIEQTHYEPIPTGKYPARITEIESSEGQFGPQLKFTFELPPNQNGDPRTILGWTSQKFSSKSKLYTWTKAALGGEQIDRSYIFNSDDLIGCKVLLTVVERESDDGEIFNKIDGVSPFVKQEPQPSPSPAYEGDDW